ncbi:MAG: lipoate protein ligase C-terminal domain-containing protein [Candidatus Thermoplasmatota archaeon]|nr:lipoate protein ligase C-terminal domain-containing protein [Candidatus Thermoplasmatota archaeon]
MPAGNGILKGELKVKGGKLLKCSLDIKDGKIGKIKITGDFFMYPEEKIEELEKMLVGNDANEEKIKSTVDEFFSGVTIFGASKENFVELVMMTIRSENQE